MHRKDPKMRGFRVEKARIKYTFGRPSWTKKWSKTEEKFEFDHNFTFSLKFKKINEKLQISSQNQDNFAV